MLYYLFWKRNIKGSLVKYFIRYFGLLIFLTISSNTILKAQDTIRLKDGHVYVVVVKLIGERQIIYKLFNDNNGPDYSIRKSRVSKIILNSGAIIDYTNKQNPTTTDRQRHISSIYENKRNAIKFELLSFLTNDLCLGFERGLGKRNSIELKVGLVGYGYHGIENYIPTEGYFVKLGYKIIYPKTPASNTLLGPYIKYEIDFTEFKNADISVKSQYAMINFGLEVGSNERITLELYGGIGISHNEVNYTNQFIFNSYYFNFDQINDRRYMYGHSTIGKAKEFAACVSGGLVLGFTF